MMKLKFLKSVWVFGAALGVPAYAHHSFAMFDFNNTTTFKATVKEFRWTNPHVVLLVDGSSLVGTAPQVGSMELTSPGTLPGPCASPCPLKPGVRFELEFNPLRDGKH